MVAILLNTFPYPARWLYWLSIVVFCFDIALFSLLTFVTILRFTLYPKQWTIMVNHPTQSLFMSAWPMGFAQIVFMIIYVCSPIWGSWVNYLAWAMWILDAVASVFIVMFMPFLHMKSKTQRELASFTALEIFPFVACLVASGTGAIVATALPNSHQALATVIVSYVLLGLGLPMSFIITTIYTQRLILQKLPPRAVIVSVFLPLGPPCMGGIAAILLGQTCLEIFPKTGTIHAQAGVIFYSLGLLGALILWGFAIMWFGLALITVYYTKKFEFNLGWWASTFPVGLLASVSIKMGEKLPSRFFRVFGAIVAFGVIMLWIMVSVMTIRGIISGRLFELPPSSSISGDQNIEKEDLEQAESVNE